VDSGWLTVQRCLSEGLVKPWIHAKQSPRGRSHAAPAARTSNPGTSSSQQQQGRQPLETFQVSRSRVEGTPCVFFRRRPGSGPGPLGQVGDPLWPQHPGRSRSMLGRRLADTIGTPFVTTLPEGSGRALLH
jgi:hypothetical protein